MIARQHKTNRGLIVALCDKKLLGKKFSEGDAIIDLSADFYKGEEVSEETALKICKKAYLVNAAGEKSVRLLLSNGFLEEKNIICIAKIPFAQCMILENEV